ncbi:glycosyltransferase 87 family protein [Planosporangium sp. 12N6]|uniref:glycosyltransferase 87 family protein n=1 Tax=Planosporangium spinosum TaxID=3402278 RepID=UPI003CE9F471
MSVDVHRHSRPGLVLAWLPATALAAAMVLAALFRQPPDRLADLYVYRGAVSGLLDGQSLYDFMTSNDAPFTYPPFAGLILLPLAGLPEWQAGIAWTVASVAVGFGIAALVARVARPAMPRAWRRWLPAGLAAALFASSPVSSNLRFGQVSIVLAVLVLIDMIGPRPSRWRGVLTGLAAAVKLTPLIFIPLLWLAGRRRAAVTASITFAAAAALAWAILPDDSARFWGTEVWRVSRLGHIATGGNQSVNGALLRFGLDDETRFALTAAASVVVGALALWRGAVAGRSGDWLSAVVVVGAASVVISPVSWTHHQIWLVLAAVLPVRGSTIVRLAWPLVALGVMIFPVTSLGSLPGPAGDLLENLRLLLAMVIAGALPLDRRLPRSATDDAAGMLAPGSPATPHPMPAAQA